MRKNKVGENSYFGIFYSSLNKYLFKVKTKDSKTLGRCVRVFVLWLLNIYYTFLLVTRARPQPSRLLIFSRFTGIKVA